MDAIVITNASAKEIAALAEELQERHGCKVLMQLDGKTLSLKDITHEVVREINQRTRKRRDLL